VSTDLTKAPADVLNAID